jgi:hypothetical protein
LYLRVVSLLDVLGSPQEAPNISLGSLEAKDLISGSPQRFVFESGDIIGCFREPPGSPQHFFSSIRGKRVFLQGAPNILYLRVAPILDVLGSPQDAPAFSVAPLEAKESFSGSPQLFVFESSVSIGCLGSPRHCQGAPIISLGSPQQLESSVIIGF